MNNLLDDLKNKIHITRKCRIGTSERLKKTNNFLQFITVYYAIFLVILAIINIKSTAESFSLIVLAFSVTISLISLFISSKGYLDRYYNMKFNYINLDELLRKLYYIEAEISEDKPEDSDKVSKYMDDINNINIEYISLLGSTENHDHIDYITYKKNLKSKEEGKEYTKKDRVYLCFFKLNRFILKLIAMIIPITVMIIIFYYILL